MRTRAPTLATVTLLCVCATAPTLAEVPLEAPSFSAGMLAIRDMHGLNLLGLGGEFITIFVAVNEASKAAEVMRGKKWIPGDDDLSWVDNQNRKQRHDPLAALSQTDRRRWLNAVENVAYLQNQITPHSTEAERADAIKAIQQQFAHMNRIIAGYRDLAEQVGFVGNATIAGDWSYLGGKGFCSVSQSANRANMACTYKPSKLAGPHYEVAGPVSGRTWYGEWRCVGAAANAKGPSCNGSLTAQVDASGKKIVIKHATDPTNEGWQGLVLTRQ